MESKDLKAEIDMLLRPLGFKRRNNCWIQETSQLYKIINLQRSYYSNSYYINYGFNIRGLDMTDDFMHVFLRLGSPDEDERKQIRRMLDLDSSLSDSERNRYLRYFVETYILSLFLKVETETELKSFLLTRRNNNDVSLKVKKYFSMED